LGHGSWRGLLERSRKPAGAPPAPALPASAPRPPPPPWPPDLKRLGDPTPKVPLASAEDVRGRGEGGKGGA